MADQKALYLQEKQRSLVIGGKDIPVPGPGDLLKYGVLVDSYPVILGGDIGGIVEEDLRTDLTAKQLDALTRFCVSITEAWFDNRHSGFQQYAIAIAEISAKVPDHVSLEEAVSVPLAFVTAAFGLYGTGGQGEVSRTRLIAPWQGGVGKYTDKAIVVLRGASSVGQYVIQLAKLSGLSSIIATASIHNEPLLKSLGATHVIDRRLPFEQLQTCVASLLPSKLEYVYDAISLPETQQIGYDLLSPGGYIMIVLDQSMDVDESSGKSIVRIFGTAHDIDQREDAKAVFSHLTQLLDSKAIKVGRYLFDRSSVVTHFMKPNRIEVLPNGLAGIAGGLKRLENDAVSGLKLIARPQDMYRPE
ncbi:GroES-like protein [Neolentinus lepideus HHB14362 ss-1]|uniref:GroES-like protein n=1 Tax=Neolentinus lepideus HHB14362 ss-1 TaxID=1314782 RepID=A0A165P6D6_9AGAM|nr:GroES-like protein [Neolentinus lepideus HHB14362 ss-1]